MTQKYTKQDAEQLVQADQITPEMIDYYVRYGNHLRAAMLAAFMADIGRRIAGLWSVKAEPAPAEQTVAERFANGLAAIRSSAEILRDTPDLETPERARFLAIVLEEERRLATALDALADHAPQAFAGR